MLYYAASFVRSSLTLTDLDPLAFRDNVLELVEDRVLPGVMEGVEVELQG